MRSRAIAGTLLFAWLQPSFAQYQTAQPGYHYEFPRDHFNHAAFQTEWWYYTGNLVSSSGQHFGFELTFFRQAASRDPARSSTWDVQDIYLAHLALSDLDGGNFYHAERMNRAGPGIAGIDAGKRRIWNGNWSAQWNGEGQELAGFDERFSFFLSLLPEKAPVIHGANGVSKKAEGPGHASHYISFTRLRTAGTLALGGKTLRVSGLSWMDHEFFTHQLAADQAGWDWLSVQLSDNSELMLFRIRRKDGSVDPFSAGTYVDPQGKSIHLRASDFLLLPQGETWTSRVSSATYPVRWKIAIPGLGIELEASTLLKSQELAGKSEFIPTYWEGAISLTGSRASKTLTGGGYLEMTGYDHPVELGAGPISG